MAKQIATQPVIKQLFREHLRRTAVVSTIPTQKGESEVDWFHKFTVSGRGCLSLFLSLCVCLSFSLSLSLSLCVCRWLFRLLAGVALLCLSLLALFLSLAVPVCAFVCVCMRVCFFCPSQNVKHIESKPVPRFERSDHFLEMVCAERAGFVTIKIEDSQVLYTSFSSFRFFFLEA